MGPRRAEQPPPVYLTEGEIKNLIHVEESKTIDLLRDGAQASLNTAILLTGDDRFGIKGFIPEVKERLDALERRVTTAENQGTERRRTDDDRFDSLTAGQQKLEDGQHRMRTAIYCCYKWLTKKGENERTGWGNLAIIFTVLGWLLNHLLHLMPTWTQLKIIVARMGWLFR